MLSNACPAADTGLPNSRRGFLRGLASLPMIGGGVAIIGAPTAAAEPLTSELLTAYSTWLAFERHYLHAEYGQNACRRMDRFINMQTPASMYHWVDYGEFDRSRERPSTRAAAVLAAVGCPWKEGGQ